MSFDKVAELFKFGLKTYPYIHMEGGEHGPTPTKAHPNFRVCHGTYPYGCTVHQPDEHGQKPD